MSQFVLKIHSEITSFYYSRQKWRQCIQLNYKIFGLKAGHSADLAVLGSLQAEILSTVKGAPLHTTLLYHPPIVLI